VYQYTMFILQSLHLLYNRYKTTVTWYLIHVMYQYTMFILQSLHLLSNRYTTTVTWYLIHVMYQYTMFILQSLHLLSNRYTTTVTWYLIHVEQPVRNGNSIARMKKRPPLKMIGTMLVSVLFRTFWQLLWTFWHCSINKI
jgi:hypothetical protein